MGDDDFDEGEFEDEDDEDDDDVSEDHDEDESDDEVSLCLLELDFWEVSMLMRHTERRPEVGQAGRRRVQAELDARLFFYVIDLKLLSYLTSSERKQNGKGWGTRWKMEQRWESAHYGLFFDDFL